MNTSLFWLGMVPIIAFVVVDAFAGKRKALAGALIIAVGELAFTLIKFGALDYLSLLAFGLLALFVGISIKTDNDFYFKIQGAIVNIITALVLLGGQYLFKKIILLDMAVKYIGLDNMVNMNPVLTEGAIIRMLSALNSQLPWWLLAHSALTVWAAARWSKWAWFTVRVPGFYLMLFAAGQIVGKSVFRG
ncbi:septation protein IspZ [Fibrobacterota bacterium]